MNFDSTTYQYQAGGSLPSDAPSYVMRQADTELYNAVLIGEYCYVLNARQMGKSSLRIRTMARLQRQGIACTEIELSGIGSQQITASQWYGGIIQELISGFALPVNRQLWLQAHDDLSPVQRLSALIEEVLLTHIPHQIVVFVDEIDSTLGLSFSTDEFFALIRHCYQKRATHPAYRRLSFVLLGVATPSDLIQHPQSTPFNIGRAIELCGFQLENSMNLATGLAEVADCPFAVLQEILNWTNGQPFLTQKLCWLVTLGNEVISAGQEAHKIKQLVQARILHYWESQDKPEHLQTIRDRILNSPRGSHLLRLHQHILQKEGIPAHNTLDHLELRLSGLVVKERGLLRVRNPIYLAVFNLQWVESELKALQTDVVSLSRWQLGLASLVGTAVIIGLRALGMLQPLELQAFDQLIRWRPHEEPDPRLLLIAITEADVQAQSAAERGSASLSDHTLNQLLTKLEQNKPRVIGLDIYRDFPVRNNNKGLAERLRRNDQLYTICQYGNPGIPAPPEVAHERQGFNNVLRDPDDILRRQLLAVSSASPCQTTYSFAMTLATQYLGIEQLSVTSEGYLQLSKVVFKPLEPHSGGYRTIDASGHQVLLNYRAVNPIAQTVTLKEFLSDQFDLRQVQDRLILIGTTAPSFNDHDWRTPYNSQRGAIKALPGLEIQAHMISQILSAALDQRPLIWWLPEVLEIVWTLGWAAIGGTLVCWSCLPLRAGLAGGIAVGFLYTSCYSILVICGGWIPLVPPALALVATGGSLLFYAQQQTQQK